MYFSLFTKREAIHTMENQWVDGIVSAIVPLEAHCVESFGLFVLLLQDKLK